MNLSEGFLHIGDFLGQNMPIVWIVVALSVICAVANFIITKSRKQLTEDAVFAFLFGLIFNVLGLLFVIFRKPVWNNLGWIPVIVAWFFIDGNMAVVIVLSVYAVIWAFAQHALLDRIQVVED